MSKLAKTKGQKVGGYDVVGTMSDGVRILRPVTKPTHFTRAEIRQTVQKVLAERRRQRELMPAE